MLVIWQGESLPRGGLEAQVFSPTAVAPRVSLCSLAIIKRADIRNTGAGLQKEVWGCQRMTRGTILVWTRTACGVSGGDEVLLTPVFLGRFRVILTHCSQHRCPCRPGG